jgi:hypothetical protein
MPQAIATAIVAAIGLTGTAAAIATAVIALAVTVGLSALANSIFGSGGAGKPSDGQRVVRVNVGSRVRHYGKVRVGGQLTFYESRSGTLYALITTSQGKLSAIAEVLINGTVVTVDGSGLVTDSRFKGAVSINNRMGTDTQTAYSQLTSVFSQWTTDHRQRGCASLLVISRGVKAEEFSEVYEGNREPDPLVTYETTAVYDPRDDSTAVIGYDEDGEPIMGSGSHRLATPSTWAYSDNWALCFADYLGDADGYGMGRDAINWTNVAQEAEICDLTVETVDARTIRQWRVAGSYKLAEDERRAVVREFLKAGDGFMWQDANGLANIRCGRWITPTVHIPEKHIIGCTASLGTDAMDRANEVRVIYMEPTLGYIETEAAPLVDDAARAALGRAEVSRFDCYFCPDHNQAQRIGKRILARLGDRWALTLTTNLYGLNVIGERFITVTLSELGITALSFEVTSIKIDPGTLNVTIGLVQASEADFAFDAAEEEGTPPSGVPSTSVAIVIEEMEGLTLAAVSVSLGGSSGVGIRATWDAPIRTGLIAQVQFKPTAASEWLEMVVSQDDRQATSGIVSSGVAHQVRGRLVTVAGRPSAWSSTVAITPTVAETAPSTPSAFSATGGTGSASLAWINSPESNFHHVEIYSSATADFGTATQVGTDQAGSPGASMTATVSLSAGTRYLWLVAYSATGLSSAPTAAQTVIVA